MEKTDLCHQVRLFVYRHFVARGQAPGIAQVAAVLDVGPDQVRQAFESLAQDHVLVLQPDTREVWMAMPFSAIPTPFRVTSGDSMWWANCAWDALGVPAMLGQDAVIDTRCPVSDVPIQLQIASNKPTSGAGGLIHFAVPAARWWEDIGYT